MKLNLFFKNSILLLLLFITHLSFAQTGVNTDTPGATLHVNYDESNTTIVPPGIIAPNLSLKQLNTYTTTYAYGELQKGAFIYITASDPELVLKEEFSNITAKGYYFFDGMMWNVFALPKSESNLTNTEPWFSTDTNLGATLDSENIFHTAQVGIGKYGPIDPNAQLEITSTSKGLIIPRLTTDERNAITSPTTSMMI